MAIAVAGARLLLAASGPGATPAAGSVHVRLWAAEQADRCRRRRQPRRRAVDQRTTPARSGATVGKGVDLHSLPPVTGLLTLGDGASIEPEVDLAGYWLDGDVLHVGPVHIGADATVGLAEHPAARRVGRARTPRSSRVGRVGPGAAPASGGRGRRLGRAGKAAAQLARPAPAARARGGCSPSALASAVMSAFPVVAAAVAAVVLGRAVIADADDLGEATVAALLAVPLATLRGLR